MSRLGKLLLGLAAVVLVIGVTVAASSGGGTTRPAAAPTPRPPRAGPRPPVRSGGKPGTSSAAVALLARERRAVLAVLAHTSYLRLGGRRSPEVALTFDDGPSPYTSRILAILRGARAPATFFVIGRQARAYPQLVAQEAREGFEIGDHTQTHPFLSLLSPLAQQQEISGGVASIEAAGGPPPVLFRPPYGSFDAATLASLHVARLLMVLWSADTKDYSQPGPDRIAYTAISGGQPGAVILMHDGGGDRVQTIEALPRIIRRLRQRGFRLVTVGRLVADDPPPATQPPPTPLSGRG